MSGAAKNRLPSGVRAGMTLARAERLATKAGEGGGRAAQISVALGALMVVGMAAYGVLGTEARTSEAVAGLAAGPEVAAAESSVDVGKLALSAPAGESDTPPALAAPAAGSVELASAGAEAGALALDPAPELAVAAALPCVQRIEGLLVSLHDSVATDGSWDRQQLGVTELVQATLDCDAAGFQVAGSLELLGSGLADLKVEWDRDAKVLGLAMIDRAEASAVETTMARDDKTIKFVIR